MKRELFKADLLVFLVLLGYGLTTSLLSIYLNNIGISLAGIGLIFALGSIATGLIRIPIGTVVDKLGKTRFIILGVIGYPIFAAGVAMANSIEHFAILQILIGLFGAIFWTAFSSHFFDIMSRGHEGAQLGVRNTVIYATAAFAPILAGIIATNLGFKILFFTGAFMGVAAIAAATTIKNDDHHRKFHFKDITDEYSDIFKLKGYKTILIGMTITSFIIALWVIFLPIWLQDQGISLEAIGALLSVNLLAGAILQVPLGKLVDKYPARMIVVPAFFFMWVGGLLFFTFKNYFSYIISRAVVGIANDASYWPLFGMLAKIAPKKEHGVAIAGVSATEAILYGTAALIGGQIATIYGIEKMLFGVVFLALFIGLALTLSDTLRQRGKAIIQRYTVNPYRHKPHK